jgi:gas vesicle protein
MKSNNSLVNILGALAVGAIAGILFAPDKGSNTRKKIASTAEGLGDDLKGGVEELSATLAQKYDEAIMKGSEIIEKGNAKVAAVKETIVSNQN